MKNRQAHKKKLKGLYAITDENLITENNFKDSVEAALQGGCRIIQYRDKSSNFKKRLQQAQLTQSLCRQYQALCIINDDIKLAKSMNADGVHLGKQDVSIMQARQLLGDNCIIGVSCYNDLSIAVEAAKNGADYVAFGAMFSSTTKPEACTAAPELLSAAKKIPGIAVCAIGGINEQNISQLAQHGADMAAVINSLFSSTDIEKKAALLNCEFSRKHGQN